MGGTYMAETFDIFEKRRDFLICVDSDGCAMDTMDIKHVRCFGPCMVREWNLEQWQEPILNRWNEINLYSMTRGVNRFKGLAIALEEIDRQYTSIPGLADLKSWLESSPALSNSALEQAAEATDSPCLRKALHWSQQVNASINQLDESLKKPFSGAAEGLAAAADFADVAVVSSANRDAVLEEWGKYGLLEHVDLVLAQDAGSKQHCIAMLLEKGYDPHRVLMVGDAPGDQAAARANGVYFYPILVKHEAASWQEFCTEAAAHLRNGTYAAYGEQKQSEFLKNLGG